MGKIAESKIKGDRIRLPRAVKLYLKLEGEQKIEWLTTTTDINQEELADDCLIVKVVRK